MADRLYVGTTPRARDFGRLQAMGIRLIINMRFLQGGAPRGAATSIRYLRLRTFDSPLLPMPVGMLMKGARAALNVMEEGGSVYVHCSRGRHRSVAMAAAILIARGMTPEQAIQLIKEKRPRADPDAFHIRPRIQEFARLWHGITSSS